ncbi:hypothetical protein ACIOTN_11425, partial [Glutamicibacter sp. NPDC087661]|uniref:hypothetical protein n=1 Tax=Glutamicibacter sp. NPDC087661 TaxID=3363996 RepID=UPI003812DB68
AMPQANVMYSPNKNIRYQQTWHTIEFSNNKHSRHHNHQSIDDCFAPEQLYKPTTKLTVVNSTFQSCSPRRFRFALSGCPDQRREIKLYTGSATTQNRPVSMLSCAESPESCGFPAVQGEYRLKTTENCCYEAGHPNEKGP